MNTIHRRGSALVLVLISSIFLIILTAGAYQYFKGNADTQLWTRERMQAKLSAEAGLNLATHMLVAGATLPTDTIPQDILGTETSLFTLPGGMGGVYAAVDPNNKNYKLIMANAFMIRCVAFVSGSTIESYGMETIVMPENLARFSVFMDNPSLDGAYVDGYRFDGPFYANGPVRLVSNSASHDNDVFFYSFELTSDYYVYGWGAGSHETTPAAGNLQMRPYNRLILGAPYFDLGVDPIPFGMDELNWEGVKNAAQADGLSLTETEVPNGSRLALKGDTLFVKTDTTLISEVAYPLGGMDNPVVWIENDPGDYFYLRGDQNQGLDMALTVGTIGDVYMSGPLIYENDDPQDPDNENLLGIMTVEGDLVIADYPGNQSAWGSTRYHIDTDSSFSYYAVVVALEGDILAEKYWEPSGVHEFRIVGGYMVQEEGYTSTGNAGFNMAVYFDPRLLYMHPPFFPTTANWNTTMWAEKHDMSIGDVKNGITGGY
ncbi:MAG: hypothetical protein K8S62_15055 [Candidatus Sabulitectum sp.]|nr:hypothetical protein [Candidatus Sabulitectum sp.]